MLMMNVRNILRGSRRIMWNYFCQSIRGFEIDFSMLVFSFYLLELFILSLKIYASYLAQAVYQTFFATCPDSRMNLTDKFKEFVSSTITEWISGSQATPESYKNWKIRADSTMLTSDHAEKNSSSNDS
jgi:hypothetical protein